MVFRRVCLVARSAYYFSHVLPSFCLSVLPSVSLSVHLPACISADPTEPISVKFDVGGFYENLSRKSKFG
jgi:hypothetical protein